MRHVTGGSWFIGARGRYLLVAGKAGFAVDEKGSGVAQQLVHLDFATLIGDVRKFNYSTGTPCCTVDTS